MARSGSQNSQVNFDDITKLNYKDIVSFLLKCSIDNQKQGQILEDSQKYKQDGLQTSRQSDIPHPNAQPQERQQKTAQPIRVEKKIERNAPCPCGSGKKYKKCHGK